MNYLSYLGISSPTEWDQTCKILLTVIYKFAQVKNSVFFAPSTYSLV